MSNFSSSEIGVQEALKKMALTEDLKSFLITRRAEWADFGKMNSHLYRAKLMKLMTSAGLSPESMLMVFVFFSIIKNRDRVIRAMENMDETSKSQAWFDKTLKFIQTHVTQYVTGTIGNTKMPAVNIPSCNPGLDILAFCLITNPADLTLDNLKNRMTFAQLSLDDELQALAKVGYANYWDNVVTGTKNPTKTEEPKMREAYYNTSAGDKYNLIGLDLKEIKPKNPEKGFTKEEIVSFMKKVSSSNAKTDT